MGSLFKYLWSTLEHGIPISWLEQRGSWVDPCWKETNTSKGRELRDFVEVKGLPCTEEIQLGRHLVSLWRPWAQWEEGIYVVPNVVKESNLLDQTLDLRVP